jgi:hypothetical protein
VVFCVVWTTASGASETGGAGGVSAGVGTAGAWVGSCILLASGSILNINCFHKGMSRPVRKKRLDVYIELIICVSVAIIMLLTSFNISTFLMPKKVLGIKTDGAESTRFDFWNSFLANNPSYIPGWIEIGRTDKVKEIDPNYIIP